MGNRLQKWETYLAPWKTVIISVWSLSWRGKLLGDMKFSTLGGSFKWQPSVSMSQFTPVGSFSAWKASTSLQRGAQFAERKFSGPFLLPRAQGLQFSDRRRCQWSQDGLDSLREPQPPSLLPRESSPNCSGDNQGFHLWRPEPCRGHSGSHWRPRSSYGSPCRVPQRAVSWSQGSCPRGPPHRLWSS